MIPQAFIGGLQTAAAFVVGMGALATVPLIGSTDSSSQEPDAKSDSSSESNPSSQLNISSELNTTPDESNFPLDLGRTVVKSSLVWLFDVMDQTQKFFAESAESFQDLITEAKIEQQAIAKSREENIPPTTKSNPPSEIQIED